MLSTWGLMALALDRDSLLGVLNNAEAAAHQRTCIDGGGGAASSTARRSVFTCWCLGFTTFSLTQRHVRCECNPCRYKSKSLATQW